jgi:hypothetical protein
MPLIQDADRRVALRAVLLACPDGEVRLDVTHLHAMGAIEDIDGLCSGGLGAMRTAASEHAPIIVLPKEKLTSSFLRRRSGCCIRTWLISYGSWISASGLPVVPVRS